MKKTLLCLSSLLLWGITGCTEKEDLGDQTGNTSLKITIAGDDAKQTRMVGEASTGNNPEVEGKVSNFTVFVFNYTTGALEKTETFQVTSAGDYTKTIAGLSTGSTKRIVVFVNVPEGNDLSSSTYDGLNANTLTLESQYVGDIADIGLFMSGESDEVTLSTISADNTVTVNVSRRVAKVVLASLIVNAGETSAAYLANFTLGGVSVQKARVTGTPIGGLVAPTGAPSVEYAVGKENTSFPLGKTYLVEPFVNLSFSPGVNIITPVSEERYFYVLPNDKSSDNPTLMTIYGTYNSKEVYFPFTINDGVINSNTKYVLSVTLIKLNTPSDDPNIIPEEVSLEVIVVPQNWEGPITQDAVW